jgi:hypothetical protein
MGPREGSSPEPAEAKKSGDLCGAGGVSGEQCPDAAGDYRRADGARAAAGDARVFFVAPALLLAGMGCMEC